MRRRYCVTALVLGVLLALVSVAPVGKPRAAEQRYQYRTFADWGRDLHDLDPGLRERAVIALSHFGTRAVPVLMKVLTEDPDDLVRLKAQWILKDMGPNAKDAVPQLISLVRRRDMKTRITAMQILEKIGPAAKDGLPVLMDVITDTNAEVRRSVVNALGGLGPAAKDATPLLIQSLRDEEIVYDAARALTRIGPTAVAALAEALSGEDLQLAKFSAWTLGKIGATAREAVPHLRAFKARLPDLGWGDYKDVADQAIREIEGTSSSTPAPGAAPQAVARGTSPEEIYRAALDDYVRGKYYRAVDGFHEYVTTYPEAAHVGSARYWLGETYLAQKRYAEAVREFDLVLREFPKSDKAPSALFKKAFAYRDLGQGEEACAALRDVTQRFRGTREARMAQAELSRAHCR